MAAIYNLTLINGVYGIVCPRCLKRYNTPRIEEIREFVIAHNERHAAADNAG